MIIWSQNYVEGLTIISYGQLPASFFFIFDFSTFNSKSLCCIIIFAKDWIQTADMWHQKRPFCQLSRNHVEGLLRKKGQEDCTN